MTKLFTRDDRMILEVWSETSGSLKWVQNRRVGMMICTQYSIVFFFFIGDEGQVYFGYFQVHHSIISYMSGDDWGTI